MTKIKVVCVLLHLLCSAGTGVIYAQDTPDDATHVLSLMTDGSDEAVSIGIKLFTQDEGDFMTIAMPGGDEVTTEYTLSETNEIIFQLARMAENGLVCIQFVGTGKSEKGLEGKFTGMVNGILRPDMSGTFVVAVQASQ